MEKQDDLPIKKWIMKQYWRVGQIRAISSLATGMLVIGRLYVDFVPILKNMGVWGALILGTFLFSIFLGLGWLYDIRLRQWSQSNQAIVERTAYYHVPLLSSIAFDYPYLYALVSTLNGVSKKQGIDNESLSQLSMYLNEYFSLTYTKRDIDRTLEMGKHFMTKHPFTQESEKTRKSTPLSSRIKLAWEVQILRLTWIQSLTGLVQDVLVFGALYVFILFPSVDPQNALFVGILWISIPLLVVLMLLGWIYDRKLKVWTADLEVKVERNPYSYVAEPSIFAFSVPFYYSLFWSLYRILQKNELDTEGIERMISYLDKYTTLESSRSEDFRKAVELRTSLGELFSKEK